MTSMAIGTDYDTFLYFFRYFITTGSRRYKITNRDVFLIYMMKIQHNGIINITDNTTAFRFYIVYP